jgi:tRNA (cytidine/uridine-2'-O-)-methyltransferase
LGAEEFTLAGAAQAASLEFETQSASAHLICGSHVAETAGVLHVVLFQPEIAPNTGNVGRMCALTRSRLHLIHPLGFVINDRNLRRAGMDYWKQLDVHEHADWAAFRACPLAPSRLWLLTTKAEQNFWQVKFADGDGLVFGNEGSGAPEWLHIELDQTRVTIPHANHSLRSLNLSTAAGVATYEALRQIGMPRSE